MSQDLSKRRVDWDGAAREAVDILQQYIRINTTNPPGQETLGAAFLKGILERESLANDIFEPAPGRGSLITRFAGRTAVPDLLLLHHIDVVPAEEDKWRQPPFSGALVSGEVWGRGALDCKSLGVMGLMALVLLKRQGLAPEERIIYAATADEEAGGALGAAWLLKKHPERLRARHVLNEGMGLGFSTTKSNLYFCQVAEKGANWIRIRFRGKPGHGSQPHDENCVAEMARAIDALASHRFPVRLTGPVQRFIEEIAAEQEFMPREEFLGLLDPARCAAILPRIPLRPLQQILGAVLRDTVVPTVVRAGSKTNVIPSECYCEIDCRILPGATPDELEQTIREIMLSRGCRNFSIQFEGRSVASESPRDTQLYRALEAAFRHHDSRAKLIPYVSSGATDSRYFREAGIPAYGIQMESSMDALEMIHGHNERIAVDQLVRGIQLMYETARQFCAGRP
jgi:acetylornithine deacetylase/succinyl-diaminopimelate desuccinylase-like protein